MKYYNEFEKNTNFTICCMCGIEDNNMDLKNNNIDLINKSTICNFYKTILNDLKNSKSQYDHYYAQCMEIEFVDGLLIDINTICKMCIKDMKYLQNLKNKKGNFIIIFIIIIIIIIIINFIIR